MKANGKDAQVSAATSRVPAPERRNLVADGEDSEMMDSVRRALQRSRPLHCIPVPPISTAPKIRAICCSSVGSTCAYRAYLRRFGPTFRSAEKCER